MNIPALATHMPGIAIILWRELRDLLYLEKRCRSWEGMDSDRPALRSQTKAKPRELRLPS